MRRILKEWTLSNHFLCDMEKFWSRFIRVRNFAVELLADKQEGRRYGWDGNECFR